MDEWERHKGKEDERRTGDPWSLFWHWRILFWKESGGEGRELRAKRENTNLNLLESVHSNLETLRLLLDLRLEG